MPFANVRPPLTRRSCAVFHVPSAKISVHSTCAVVVLRQTTLPAGPGGPGGPAGPCAPAGPAGPPDQAVQLRRRRSRHRNHRSRRRRRRWPRCMCRRRGSRCRRAGCLARASRRAASPVRGRRPVPVGVGADRVGSPPGPRCWRRPRRPRRRCSADSPVRQRPARHGHRHALALVGLGVSLVPASVRNMTVEGAISRPVSDDATRVELAAAWRSDDDRPVLRRALDVVRRSLRGGTSGKSMHPGGDAIPVATRARDGC